MAKKSIIPTILQDNPFSYYCEHNNTKFFIKKSWLNSDGSLTADGVQSYEKAKPVDISSFPVVKTSDKAIALGIHAVAKDKFFMPTLLWVARSLIDPSGKVPGFVFEKKFKQTLDTFTNRLRMFLTEADVSLLPEIDRAELDGYINRGNAILEKPDAA